MGPAAGARASLRRIGRHAIVVAHRGASASFPENSMPAFRAAWEAGVTWVEADTQPTADGVPVILHDADVDRTTSGSGAVRAHTAMQVSDLALRDLPGEHVPTLADLLDLLTPNRAVLLEIKGEHRIDQVAEIIRLSRSSGQDDRILLQSFEVAALQHIRSIEPARQFGLLVDRLDDDPVATCRDLGAVAYNPDYHQVLANPDVVPALRTAGVSVAVWTSDDPAEWAALTGAGVDAIITNTPADLLEWQRTN